MRTRRQASASGRAVLGFVLLSALYSGCQSLEMPSGHDSCYERDGMLCRNYGLTFEGARIATLASLKDLNMPVRHEGRYRHGIFVDTRTPDNLEVRIVILPQDRQAEGTRIGVGVGGFGTHRHVCEHLLDEIARHLDYGRHYLDAGPRAQLPSQPSEFPASSPMTTMPPPRTQSSEASLPPQPVPVEQKQ